MGEVHIEHKDWNTHTKCHWKDVVAKKSDSVHMHRFPAVVVVADAERKDVHKVK